MLTPFTTVLVANRGEIACRIMRSLRDMGLRSVAVYTDADAEAPHVAMADGAVRIGAGPVGDSYLSISQILSAARSSGVQAIHPGYGFLSENADFARAVQDAGLVFIGPAPDAIAAMGDKAQAKRAMIATGVPCVPGYQGSDQSDATLVAEAAKIGFPVMVKASAGGGGRGMRVVDRAEDLPDALGRARSEAMGAFGSDVLILEKAVQNPRHVEVQIFADAHGTCLHMGERDCSIQRRHQKIIEEAPCPVMTPDLRAAMGAAAIRAAQSVGYIGAGTVEFLLDANRAFYFLEMNTRLQVEHPVTEAVTGLDLVALQIQVAQGAPLGLAQEDIRLTGHAIELRLYAEDPANDFLPSTGRIALWQAPRGAGIRTDAGIVTGLEVSPFYDPMLAKIIAHGATRDEARLRALAALPDMALLGVQTNARFLGDVLRTDAFASGQATTEFIAQTYPDGIPQAAPGPRVIALAGASIAQAQYRAAMAASTLGGHALRGLGAVDSPVDIVVDGAVHHLKAAPVPAGWRISAGDAAHDVCLAADHAMIDGQRLALRSAVQGDVLHLGVDGASHRVTPHMPWQDTGMVTGSGRITAPMPGQVISVAVSLGQTVEAGEPLAVIEAMKMQHSLTADIAGIIRQIDIAPGDQVAGGATVIIIEEQAE